MGAFFDGKLLENLCFKELDIPLERTIVDKTTHRVVRAAAGPIYEHCSTMPSIRRLGTGTSFVAARDIPTKRSPGRPRFQALFEPRKRDAVRNHEAGLATTGETYPKQVSRSVLPLLQWDMDRVDQPSRLPKCDSSQPERLANA